MLKEGQREAIPLDRFSLLPLLSDIIARNVKPLRGLVGPETPSPVSTTFCLWTTLDVSRAPPLREQPFVVAELGNNLYSQGNDLRSQGNDLYKWRSHLYSRGNDLYKWESHPYILRNRPYSPAELFMAKGGVLRLSQ